MDSSTNNSALFFDVSLYTLITATPVLALVDKVNNVCDDKMLICPRAHTYTMLGNETDSTECKMYSKSPLYVAQKKLESFFRDIKSQWSEYMVDQIQQKLTAGHLNNLKPILAMDLCSPTDRFLSLAMKPFPIYPTQQRLRAAILSMSEGIEQEKQSDFYSNSFYITGLLKLVQSANSIKLNLNSPSNIAYMSTFSSFIKITDEIRELIKNREKYHIIFVGRSLEKLNSVDRYRKSNEEKEETCSSSENEELQETSSTLTHLPDAALVKPDSYNYSEFSHVSTDQFPHKLISKTISSKLTHKDTDTVASTSHQTAIVQEELHAAMSSISTQTNTLNTTTLKDIKTADTYVQTTDIIFQEREGTPQLENRTSNIGTNTSDISEFQVHSYPDENQFEDDINKMHQQLADLHLLVDQNIEVIQQQNKYLQTL